ncbi:MAG: hypothetical protein ACM3ST_11360 [Bdellovibrio bacteriovorus]
MGEGVVSSPPGDGDLAPPPHLGPPLDPADWQRAARRLDLYLRALGVREPAEAERLREQVRLRVEARSVAAPLEDPVEAAIEETHALLDQWLATELGLEGDANGLCAARAAVLGGGLPGWSARWAGLSDASVADAIRANVITAVPDPASLAMEPNPIDLFLHRLGCRLASRFNRLLCRAGNAGTAARGHP